MNVDISSFFETFLYVLTVIATIGAATAVLSRWYAPVKKLKSSVDDKVDKNDFDALKREVEKLSNYQETDHDRLKSVETGTEKICKCVLAITDHELTGNSVDKLRQAKDEMQNYLIEK